VPASEASLPCGWPLTSRARASPRTPGKAERAGRMRCAGFSRVEAGGLPDGRQAGLLGFLLLSSRKGYQNCAARFRRIARLAPRCSSGKRLSAIPVSGYSS